jgi:hypothetical protein
MKSPLVSHLAVVLCTVFCLALPALVGAQAQKPAGETTWQRILVVPEPALLLLLGLGLSALAIKVRAGRRT